MGLLSLFKLEKLTITAYKDSSGTDLLPDTFEAMFNPTSWEQSYSILWGKKQGVNSSGSQLAYSFSEPSCLKLNLILDGTGVDSIGLFASTTTVQDRVDQFLKVAYRYNGKIHQPSYLVLSWGDREFPCRLASVDIKYTAFNRDGTALRAELAVSLVADIDDKQRAKKENKSSPDLTHARIVCSGDTLPLLTREIYGSSACYLDVARYNKLDDFRTLTPGQQLLFPPLAAFATGDSEGG